MGIRDQFDRGDFRDAALVLLAHGSTVNPDSARPTQVHADSIRRAGFFGEVTEAYWKQEPAVAGVLRGVFSRRVFLVPFFVSEGWFTVRVLPRALGWKEADIMASARVRQHGDQTLYYCEPVGTHSSMTRVLAARALGVMARFPFPDEPKASETSLFVVGHGTSYSPGSRESVEHQVSLLRAQGTFARVHGVFLEEDPRVGACWGLAATDSIVVVPYFMADGLHTREDIPVFLGLTGETVRRRMEAGQPTWRNPTEREGKRLWIAEAIGSDPSMVDVILERVREAAAGECHRRSSDSTGE